MYKYSVKVPLAITVIALGAANAQEATVQTLVPAELTQTASADRWISRTPISATAVRSHISSPSMP